MLKSSIDKVCLLSKNYKNLTIIIGAPWFKENARKPINAAIVIRHGSIEYIQAKALLPNYDVFDERRYFDSSLDSSTFDVNGVKCSVVICEDAWFSQHHDHSVTNDPVLNRKEKRLGFNN